MTWNVGRDCSDDVEPWARECWRLRSAGLMLLAWRAERLPATLAAVETEMVGTVGTAPPLVAAPPLPPVTGPDPSAMCDSSCCSPQAISREGCEG